MENPDVAERGEPSHPSNPADLELYRANAIRFLTRFTHQSHLAEDLFQDFCVAYLKRSREVGEPILDFESYMCRSLHNLFRKHVDRPVNGLPVLPSGEAMAPAPTTGPVTAHDRREQHDRILNEALPAVGGPEDDHRRVLDLKLKGLSTAEIVKLCAEEGRTDSPRTVTDWLTKGRIQLAKALLSIVGRTDDGLRDLTSALTDLGFYAFVVATLGEGAVRGPGRR